MTSYGKTRAERRLEQLRALCPDDGELMTPKVVRASDEPGARFWLAGFVCPLHPDEVVRLWRPEFDQILSAARTLSPTDVNLVRLAHVRHVRHVSSPPRRIVVKIRLSGHTEVVTVTEHQDGESLEAVAHCWLEPDEWCSLRALAEDPELLELPAVLGGGPLVEQVVVYLGNARFETGATVGAHLPAPLARILPPLRALIDRALRGELRTNPLRRSVSGEIDGGT